MSRPWMIDVHAHSLPASWHEALNHARNDTQQPLVPGFTPPWSVEDALRMMDAHGIAASVLSVPNGSQLMTRPGARELARRINEEFAGIIARHPGRFGAFAVLPQQDLDEMAEESVYALDVLQLEGVWTSTHINGIYLGDPCLDAWFEELNRRHAVLFAHPGTSPWYGISSMGMSAAYLDFMFDTTRALTHLVFSGRKKRFSDIRIISTHGGGTIPYLVHRLSLLEPLFGPGEGRQMLTAEEVRDGFASFYYDLTASMQRAPLSALLELVPSSQLLMGFDFPMMPESLVQPAQDAFFSYEGFTDADRDAVCRHNACALFPRLAHAIEATLAPAPSRSTHRQEWIRP